MISLERAIFDFKYKVAYIIDHDYKIFTDKISVIYKVEVMYEVVEKLTFTCLIYLNLKNDLFK